MSNTLQIHGYAICNGTITYNSGDQILVSKNYVDSLIISKSFNVGEIRMFAGTTIPIAWLFCGGQPLDGADPQYSALYNVIGTNYGDGDGGTYPFNLPNLSQRLPIGSTSENQIYINYQGNNSVVNSGNSTLSTNQLPSHSHTFSHTHTLPTILLYNQDVTNSSNGGSDNNSSNWVNGQNPTNTQTSTYSYSTEAASLTSGSSGSGVQFLPPFTTVSFIIYYGG